MLTLRRTDCWVPERSQSGRLDRRLQGQLRQELTEAQTRVVAEMMGVIQEREGGGALGVGRGLDVHTHLAGLCPVGALRFPSRRITRYLQQSHAPPLRCLSPCHPDPALLNATDESSRHSSLAVAFTRLVPRQSGLAPLLEAPPKGKPAPTHHPQPPGPTELPCLINCLLHAER